MRNLFVGNLSFQTTESDLTALFEPFGEIARIQVMTDRDTGRSRGFAFVEMANEEAGAKWHRGPELLFKRDRRKWRGRTSSKEKRNAVNRENWSAPKPAGSRRRTITCHRKRGTAWSSPGISRWTLSG